MADSGSSGTEEILARLSVDVVANVVSAEKSLNQFANSTNSQFQGIAKNATNVASQIGSVFGGMVASLTSGFDSLSGFMLRKLNHVLNAFKQTFSVRKILNEAGGYEEAENRFKTLLGSMEEGKRILADISQMALDTIFDSPDLQESFAQLKIAGDSIDAAQKNMHILSDIAAGTGQKMSRLAIILGQVKLEGRALTQDMRQFANAGIPIWNELASTMGVSVSKVKEMVSLGKVSADDVNRAFENMTKEGGIFFEASTNAATGKKALENELQEKISVLQAELGYVLLESYKVLLEIGIKILDTFIGWAQALRPIGAMMARIARFTWNGIQGAVGAFKAIDESLGGAASNAIKILAALTLASKIKLASNLPNIGNMAGSAVDILSPRRHHNTKTGKSTSQGMFSGVTHMLKKAWAGLKSIGSGLMKLFRPLLGMTSKVVTAITGAIGSLVAFFAGGGPLLAAAGVFAAMAASAALISSIFNGLTKTVSAVWKRISEGIAWAFEPLTEFFSKGQEGGRMLLGISKALLFVWEKVKSAFGWIGAAVKTMAVAFAKMVATILDAGLAVALGAIRLIVWRIAMAWKQVAYWAREAAAWMSVGYVDSNEDVEKRKAESAAATATRGAKREGDHAERQASALAIQELFEQNKWVQREAGSGSIETGDVDSRTFKRRHAKILADVETAYQAGKAVDPEIAKKAFEMIASMKDSPQASKPSDKEEVKTSFVSFTEAIRQLQTKPKKQEDLLEKQLSIQTEMLGELQGANHNAIIGGPRGLPE